MMAAPWKILRGSFSFRVRSSRAAYIIKIINTRRQNGLLRLQNAFSYLTDLGKNELHSPDLTLAAETVLSANAELLVQTLTLVGATRSAGGQTVYSYALELKHKTLTNITQQPLLFKTSKTNTYSFYGGHK